MSAFASGGADRRALAPLQQAFPKAARLCTARDFKGVFDAVAVRSRDRGFTVLATRRAHGRGRLGLAISKRQIRSAARRNWVKRRIRESFRAAQHALDGIDVVVMAKRGVEQWPSAEVAVALERHWIYVRRKCDTRCED